MTDPSLSILASQLLATVFTMTASVRAAKLFSLLDILLVETAESLEVSFLTVLQHEE
jgi:hypothetical protein